MITSIMLTATLMPLMLGSLFFSIAKWREQRDRAVYLQRTGRTPF